MTRQRPAVTLIPICAVIALFLCLIHLTAGAFVPAQSIRASDLAAGKLLVADQKLADPNFAERAVLLLHYDEDGAVGLIINRRTKVPISRVFDDVKAAKGRSDPVYVGGPVDLTAVRALLRSSRKPEGAQKVFGDVYLVSSKPLLEKALAEGKDSSALHVYLGYAGWGAGQLEAEVKIGAWYIFRGDADAVFAPDPDAVWLRLFRRRELQIARAY